MIDEDEFEQTVRERIARAHQLTGHSFSGLISLIDKIGAVKVARRLISPRNIGKFHFGMRVLFRAGLLDHSIEQAVIEFGECGKIFTAAEVASAKDRLRLMRMLFSGKE